MLYSNGQFNSINAYDVDLEHLTTNTSYTKFLIIYMFQDFVIL
jgi:hypothetical protein